MADKGWSLMEIPAVVELRFHSWLGISSGEPQVVVEPCSHSDQGTPLMLLLVDLHPSGKFRIYPPVLRFVGDGTKTEESPAMVEPRSHTGGQGGPARGTGVTILKRRTEESEESVKLIKHQRPLVEWSSHDNGKEELQKLKSIVEHSSRGDGDGETRGPVRRSMTERTAGQSGRVQPPEQRKVGDGDKARMHGSRPRRVESWKVRPDSVLIPGMNRSSVQPRTNEVVGSKVVVGSEVKLGPVVSMEPSREQLGSNQTQAVGPNVAPICSLGLKGDPVADQVGR